MEIINPNIKRDHIRHALFDFDGTLSLNREGWRDVIIPLMAELLLQTPRHESETELHTVVAEFVDRLTGKQTIYQMIQLCEEIDRRGGEAADPVEYKKMYHARLWTHIQHRVAAAQGGQGKATTSYGKIDVPAKPSVVVSIDKSNVKAALIDSGYYQAGDFTVLKYSQSVNAGIVMHSPSVFLCTSCIFFEAVV